MKRNTSLARCTARVQTSPHPRRHYAYAWCVKLLCLALCYALVLQQPAPLTPGHAAAAAAAPERGAKPATLMSLRRAGPVKSRGSRNAGELLVRFRSSTTAQEASAVLEAKGLRRKDKLRGASGIERLSVDAGQDLDALSYELRSNPAVEYVEPNFTITADQLSTKIPFLPNQRPTQEPALFGRAAGAVAAMRNGQRSNAATKTVVAVIDSGVDFTHAELRTHRWVNRAEQKHGRDDTGDGYADDFSGWDYVAGSNEIKDESGHGTAIAGIIAAQWNEQADATEQASLMSLRVLDDSGNGDTAAAVEAIDYAVAHGAQIINCSWSMDASSRALREAIMRAAKHNVLVVCAAGNGSKDLDNAPRYPASFSSKLTLAVAATNDADALATWSNWGARSVAVAAPGADVRTIKADGGHGTVSGTSASAAVVSGVAGRLRALRPDLSATQLRALITGNVRRVASLQGKVTTGGIVDTGAALSALNSLPPGAALHDRDDSAAADDQTGERGRHKGSLAPIADQSSADQSPGQMIKGPKLAAAPAAGLPNLDAAKRLRSTAPRVLPPVPSSRPRLPVQKSCCSGTGNSPTAQPAPTPGAASPDSPIVRAEKPTHDFLLASLFKQSLLANLTAALDGRQPAFDLSELDYYRSGGYAVADASGNALLPALATASLTASAAFVLDAPTNLSVTLTTATQVNLSWTATAGASGYQIERSPGASGLFAVVGNTTTATSFTDLTATNGNAYLYRVRAVNGSTISPASNLALGTAITFLDATLLAQVTTIKAQHIYDLRTAVNAVRRAAGLADATWQDATLTQVIIKAIHIQELRDRLNEALVALSIPTSAYTDATLATGTNGTVIKKIHVDELRQRATRGIVSGSIGGGSGLTARYFDNLDFTNFKFGRVDSTLNFDWGNGSPAASVGSDQFSVRWMGFVQARYSQTYTFYTTTDDGIRVWVNGQLIIDNWTDHVPTVNTGTITLTAGALTPIKVEFFENFGGALARLEWSSTSQPREVVPQAQLYPCWKDLTQFVRDFYQGALYRQPTANELQDWTNTLMQAQGETQLIAAAGALGRTLFTSSEYATRNPSDNQLFVYDCYRAYLQRNPDQSGWDFWTAQANANGRVPVLAGFDGSSEFHENVRRLCDFSATAYSFSSSRLDPTNRTGGAGVDPLSRNYNWSVPLLSLPGRAGSDLGLTLSYNSLVWTRDGSGITYDADHGTPAPGFRLGFPVVQPRFFDPQTGKETYMLIAPSGGRTGLRRVGSTNVFESADSSYMQLLDNGPSLLLRTTDGTRLTFALLNGEYHCIELKDRNGNYISVNRDGLGQVTNIVDTLGRLITFNYDQFQNLISITQPWTREGDTGQVVNETHTWASFGYTDLTLQPNFANLAIIGAQPGTIMPVLQRVGLGDGSYYKFDYNQWGQVWKITHFAADSVSGGVAQDTHALSYLRYNVPGSDLLAASPQTDCPRFTEQRLWIENGVMNQSAEVMKTYNPWSPNLTSCDITTADGTLYRDVYGTGWQKGLTVESFVFSADNLSTPKKHTLLTWTQDDENLPYQLNPRVREINLSDEANNHSRTTITHVAFGLPQDVTEYAADAQTPLRTTRSEYNLGQAYLDRRIIGLPSVQYIYAGTPTSGSLSFKIEYVYDDASDANFLQALPAAASQHDATNYGSGMWWRGNLNRVRRYDVTGAANTYAESRVGYNTAGSVVFVRDPDGHQTNISYTDSFYQGINRAALGRPTFAYQTTVTDPDNFATTTEHNYDTGGATRSTDPKGAMLRTRYDAAGRVARSARFDGATEQGYLRRVYPLDMGLVQSFSLVDNGLPEAYAASVLDGLGQVRATAQSNPGSTGYSGVLFDYDVMGRLARQSNPTETTGTGTWPATGDDAPANGGNGWVYRQWQYDWQGRVKAAINPDNTQKLAGYSGCGCAGGASVTFTDEVGRRQRVTSDILGRAVKTEVLNADGSVYRALVNTINARDQITRMRDFQGAAATDDSCPTGTCQETLMSYDGHGRLASRKSTTCGTHALLDAEHNLHRQLRQQPQPKHVLAV